MSKVADAFLASYKDYETIVRTFYKEPLDVENEEKDQQTKDRLRICRQIRNYLSHSNDPGFVEPTLAMTKFVQGQAEEWKYKQDIVKNHLKSPAASICDSKASLAEAMQMISKLSTDKLVVYDAAADNYSIKSVYAILKLASTAEKGIKRTKVSEVPSLKYPIEFVPPTLMMEKVNRNAVNICLSEGNVKKCKGVVML